MKVNNNKLSKKTIGLKKITGVILVICMIVGVLPLSTALRVRADDVAVLVSSFSELRSALSAGKTAKLTGDVSGNSLSVNGAATLDLNGFILSSPIKVYSRGVLTLIDSDPDTEHSELSFVDQIDGETIHEVKGGVITNGIVTVDGGKFIMDGGTLTGNSGIYVIRAGSAVMNAGFITGNIGSTGSFESDDGTWKGCGPVSVMGNGSVFTMKGGTISYNAGRDFQGMLAEYPDGERTLEDILYNQSGGMGAWGGGTITIEDGSIFGNIHDDGGAVLIGPDGTLNLLGGEICGNVASTGGGIYMFKGTFNMSGGSLSYNKAIGWGTGGALGGWSTLKWSMALLSSSGVGQGDPLISPGASSEAQVTIEITNTIKITGGTIEGNYAKECGGGIASVAVCDFELSGGARVIGNTAGTDGGGIMIPEVALTLDIGGGTVVRYPGNIEIGDCTVTGNTAGGKGGGIWAPNVESNESVEITSGDSGDFIGTVHLPTTKLNFSGKVVITDNTSGSDGAKTADNLYLHGDSPVYAKGDLTGSDIGVNFDSSPSASEPVVFTENLSGNGDDTIFTSDRADCGVKLNESGEAVLGFYTYNVSLADTVNGSVSASVEGSTGLTDIAPGKTVTVTLDPDADYVPDKLTVMWGAREVPVTAGANNTYTFTMPGGDVTIAATFDVCEVSMGAAADSSKTRADLYFTIPDDADPNCFTVTMNGVTTALNTVTPDENGYKVSLTVPAKNMGDKIAYSLNYNDTAVKSGEVSVADYANNLAQYYPQYADFVDAMLAYGAAAQTYFNYDADDLVSDADLTALASVTAERFDAAAIQSAMIADASIPVHYSAMNVTFLADTTLSVALRIKDGFTDNEALEWVNTNITLGGAAVEDAISVNTTNDMRFVIISKQNIALTNIDMTMDLVVGTAGTYSISVLNYFTAVEAAGSDNLKLLTRALYAYSQAAEAIAD